MSKPGCFSTRISAPHMSRVFVKGFFLNRESKFPLVPWALVNLGYFKLSLYKEVTCWFFFPPSSSSSHQVMTTQSNMPLFRRSKDLSKFYTVQVKEGNKEELYGRGIKQLYRTRLKGTWSQFLSVILSLYGICYTLTGIKFLSWMEQYRVTGSYCTLQSTGTLTGK